MIDAQSRGRAATTSDPDDTAGDPFDRVAEDFIERCRRGESPSIGEYEARYPEHAHRIRDLLPSVAMMEQLKRRQRAAREAEAEPVASEPDRLGDYRILRELGRGGMGIVYEAVQESLGRHVALKVIPRHAVLDPKRRQRFQREAQAVAQLHHTNIVPIFAVGEHDGLPYFAMQYIRGSGLDHRLETWRGSEPPRGQEHWRFVARVGVQAAEALQYAHEQGILHRDIKPANLLLDEHQVVWITDFGLAKLAGREDLTNSGDVIGTLRYLAPEALRGQTDQRSDIYSLGLTLYELLTLQLPFGDLSPSELLRCVTEEQPTRPRKLDRTIPLDLETIILKATAREPDHRYAMAGDLADDLRSFLDDRPIRTRRARPLERLTRWCRRNRTIAALMAAVAVLFLLTTIVGWVGYASTTHALQRESQRRHEAETATRRAEANVALSLAAFEDLFDKLADRGEFGPVMNGLASNGPPAPPPHGGRRPMSGPPGSLPKDLPENDAALIQSVLDFYDRFAAGNETNSRLQGEAARAHRRVAALDRWLGHNDEADQAHARATERFEGLVDRDPGVPEYRFELAKTYAMDDQHRAESIPPERIERGLRKALPLVDRLAAESPNAIEYVMAQARWKARLGAALRRLDRPAEAETAYRESIAHDESLLGRFPDPVPVRFVLSTNREALAHLLLEQGRRGEARTLLDRAAADLDGIATDECGPRNLGRLGERIANLSESYRQLGETARAAELADRADRLRPPRPPEFPNGGGRRFGPGGDRSEGHHPRPAGP
jgi:serine/threonine protein kinase